MFVAHESGASLFELPSGRRIANATIPPGWRPAVARYLAEGAVRAWLVPSDNGPAGPRRAEMRIVDLATDGTSSATAFPVDAAGDPVVGGRLVLPDALGQRILTSEAGLRLRDGATGAPLARLGEYGGSHPAALFLADGRILVEGVAPTGQTPFPHPRVRVFDRAGAQLADFEVPLTPHGILGLGPELAPGRVLFSYYRVSSYGWLLSEDAVVVDVASGAVVKTLLPGLRTEFRYPMGGSSPAGSSVQFFSVDERSVDPATPRRNHVVRIDFATGERKVVAGLGAPRGERLSAR